MTFGHMVCAGGFPSMVACGVATVPIAPDLTQLVGRLFDGMDASAPARGLHLKTELSIQALVV